MAFARGKRVAVAAVVVGLLLIAGAGLAYREELVRWWSVWSGRAEEETRKKLATPISVPPHNSLSLPDYLKLLSDTSGTRIVLSTSSEAKMRRYFYLSRDVTSEASLQSILNELISTMNRLLTAPQTPQILDYTVKGDTVVIGLRAKNSGNVTEALKPLTSP